MLHGKIALNSVLLLLLMTFVSGLRFELIYISLIVSIKPHSSPCFSAACAAAIVYRNHFFSFVPINQNKSSDSKVKFRQSSNRCKKVLEAAKIADAVTKIAYVTKIQKSISSQKLGSWDFLRISK